MNSTDAINIIRKIIGRARSWEKEVRFNSLFEFGSTLLFFGNTRNILKFDKTPGAEYLMPQGIVEIATALLNKQLTDEEKLQRIKEILLSRGFDGHHDGSSWKRTNRTNKVYKQIADLIASYENPGDSPFMYRF